MTETVVRFAPAFKALFKPKRLKVFYGGRGGAKSWAFAQALVIMAAQRPMRVLCAREYQKSIKESVHRLLVDSIVRADLGGMYQILDKSIRGANGSEFLFEGVRNNPHAIKSLEGIDICWVEEAEAVSDESWKFLIPTIRKEGSEIWVSFNPSWEDDPTATRFIMPYLADLSRDGEYEDDRIYVRKVSWRDNPWFPDTLKAEMEHDRKVDEAKYQHVWEGEFQIAVQGAIYGNELKEAEEQGRITRVPIVKKLPVCTFWDLGRRDTTCIVFMQFNGTESRVIDFYESRFNGLEHYAKVLQEKGYLYDEHYLPHDVDVEEIGSGLTRKSQLESMGVSPITVVPRVQKIEDGIEALRSRFSELYIDRDRCAPLIKALKAYSHEYDEKTGTFRDKPGPKWATNPVDALRQWAQGYDGPALWDDYDSYRAPSVA